MGHDVTVLMDRYVGRFGPAGAFASSAVKLRVLDVWCRFRRRHQREDRLNSQGLFVDQHEVRVALANLRTVLDLVRQSDAVVVGGYATRSALCVLILPRRLRPPTVMLAERPDHRTIGIRRVLRDAVIRWTIRRCDSVWAMSETGREMLESRGARVPLLAPYPFQSKSARRTGHSVGDVGGPLRVAVIGRLDAGKDPLAAAAAFRVLHERGVPFVATFCGTGPLEAELAAAVSHLPVRLLGHISPEQVQQVLSDTDVLLHPSRYDGWGVVVAEAVAVGVGVVASDQTDSASEFSRLSDTVLAVPTDPERLADAIESLADLVRSDRGVAALQVARETAQLLAGVDQVASRTLEDLMKRAKR
jgi:glycosyltransferase involved in cell wall biosynthesis